MMEIGNRFSSFNLMETIHGRYLYHAYSHEYSHEKHHSFLTRFGTQMQLINGYCQGVTEQPFFQDLRVMTRL